MNLKPFKEEMAQQGNNTKMELDMLSAQLQELNAALMKLGDRLNNKDLENERLKIQLAECLKTQQNLKARNKTMNLMSAQLQEKDAVILTLCDRLNELELENERLKIQLTARYENEFVLLSLLLCSFFSLILV